MPLKVARILVGLNDVVACRWDSESHDERKLVRSLGHAEVLYLKCHDSLSIVRICGSLSTSEGGYS